MIGEGVTRNSIGIGPLRVVVPAYLRNESQGNLIPKTFTFGLTYTTPLPIYSYRL
jgi:hypothetical protein